MGWLLLHQITKKEFIVLKRIQHSLPGPLNGFNYSRSISIRPVISRQITITACVRLLGISEILVRILSVEKKAPNNQSVKSFMK